jgi:cardiolipin synthase A/B
MPDTDPRPQQDRPRPRRLRRRWVVLGVVVTHLLGFASAVDALMTARTAPGAVAWIVSLGTFPYAAVPAYWVFGRSRFQGYVVGRRDINSALHQALQEKLDTVLGEIEQPARTHHLLQAIERLAKIPMLGGNQVELLQDGRATFDSLLAGIDAAERYLLVQFYIVRDDGIGRELQQRLIARARAGVPVHFMYDEIGSYLLPRSYLDELTAAGVHVRHFESTRGLRNRFQLNFRNHRKVLVADGQVGWVGGLNVGDEYLGRDPAIGPWRDTHMRIEGPAVFGLQLSFLEDWHWSTGEILDYDWQAAPAASDGVPVLIVPSGPADRFETASLMVQHALASARERIWIASPYFVPDESVQSALKLAALRGVDVRVLIPEEPDNRLMRHAAYAFVGPMLDAGVRVFRHHEGFLHRKTMVVDWDAGAVGTVNLDNRSFRLNFEITAWVADPAFTEELATHFEQDFAGSYEMSPEDLARQPWWERVMARGAYLLAPVL